jgi:hypothetical protein
MKAMQAVTLAALVGVTPLVEATPVTIDFEGPSIGIGFDIYAEDGFRLLPGCHYHVIAHEPNGTPFSPFATNWFSADISGCRTPEQKNPVGVAPDIVRLDADGVLFDLLSVGAVKVPPVIKGSSGATVQLCSAEELGGLVCAGTVTLEGPEWRNLQWVDFFFDDTGPVQGIDDIVVRKIAEPESLALMALGLLVLCDGRRRREETQRVAASRA